ncbi:MAG: GNAT family N-acetyltransferase [Aggregatilineales bacterium]
MPDFALYPLKESDIPTLHALLWQERSSGQVNILMRHMLRAMQREHGLALVAWQKTQIIGYGQVLKWGNEAEISELIIIEAQRSTGIGTAMIRRFLQFAGGLSVKYALIGVEETNTRAQSLYERLGFREERRMVLNDAPDIIYLTKQLMI